MLIISFAEETETAWVVAGWVFHHLLADVLAQHPNDAEMAAAFDRAQALGLFLEDGEDKVLAREAGGFNQGDGLWDFGRNNPVWDQRRV